MSKIFNFQTAAGMIDNKNQTHGSVMLVGHGWPAQGYVGQRRASVERQIRNASLAVTGHQVVLRRTGLLFSKKKFSQ